MSDQDEAWEAHVATAVETSSKAGLGGATLSPKP